MSARDIDSFIRIDVDLPEASFYFTDDLQWLDGWVRFKPHNNDRDIAIPSQRVLLITFPKEDA